MLLQPKYGRRKRRFRERSCCDAAKNTFTSRGPLEGFALKMEYTRKIGCQTKSWNTTRNKLLLGWVFLLEILIFFPVGEKMVELRNFFIK